MEILKKARSRFGFVAGLMALGACGISDTVTEVVSVPMDSDTYIVKDSEETHGGEEFIDVATNGDEQSYGLIPLPSSDGSRSAESFATSIVESIFEGIFGQNCDRSKILKPEYLTSVTLVLTPTNATISAQAAQMSLRPLDRDWWQGATWTRAHPFTSAGRWETPGGDVMASVAAVTGTQDETRVSFDVKSLVVESASLFDWGNITALNGFRIEAADGVTMTFHSSQSVWPESDRPRMDFEYTGPCVPLE